LVDADQESLKIILRNLLDNAIKFSNQDGAIKLYSKMWILTFVIEDSGLGMDESTRQELLKETVLLEEENEDIVGTD
jgi:signal transduction histidine kinase